MPQQFFKSTKLNKMIILNISGNITADAVIKEVNGVSLVAFTVASNTRYKTKSGQAKEETEFVRCAIWNKPQMASLIHKGRPINATGILKINRWIDGDGKEQTSINIRVSFLQVFGKNAKKEIVQETHTVENVTLSHEDENEAVKDLPF